MNDTHQHPEQRARGQIDRLLRDAGWQVQDMADFNRNAALGVAVREFHLPSGPCDYLLFVDGKARSNDEPASELLARIRAEREAAPKGKLRRKARA